jgi:hypothetical protein
MKYDNYHSIILTLSKTMIINLPRVKKVRFLILKTLFATILTLSVVTAQLRSQDFGDVRPPAFLTQRDLERQATAVKNTEIQERLKCIACR